MKRLFRALYRQLNFSPTTLTRAFADPRHAPSQLVELLAAPPPGRLDLLLRIVLNARPVATPRAPMLLAWGAADRLPGSGAASARKLQRTLPGARLVLIPAAGHCPQLERPTALAAAISSFADAAAH
jgi:pimeloyl-ACP methyl ester carboxylesterase